MGHYDTQRHSDRMIKVCGMADPKNIESVARLTPMLMGFIFYEKSPRYAGNLPVESVKSLPDYIYPVGLFVDSDIDHIINICDKYGIRIVQLHGDESPALCGELKARGFTVMKAFGIDSETDWSEIEPYEEVTDLYVFDTKTSSKGGSGMKFDWSLLDNYPLSNPYLISGGIGPDDIDAIIKAMNPKMAGVDINSRFESAPGIKDIKKLTHFILSLRKYNEDESFTIPFWTKK